MHCHEGYRCGQHGTWNVYLPHHPLAYIMSQGRGRGTYSWQATKDIVIKQSAEERLKKERDRLKASVQSSNYVDSSSEEEDVDTGNIMETVVQGYMQQGGGDLGKTREFLNNSFQSGAGVCLICISSIKRVDPVWHCAGCYGCFHIVCIQKWSRDSLFQQKQAMEELPRFRRSDKLKWGCPKCRRNYDENDIPTRYYCYCGKAEDPNHHPWLIPHSCGDVCDRPLLPECGHRCLLLCHPGPCPPCPKSVKSNCFCGKVGPQAKRCSEKLWSCQQTCGKKLSCGKHLCGSKCHPDSCPSCPQESEQYCDCGLQNTKRPCSAPNWKCGKVCGKAYNCGNHVCTLACHKGLCGECPLALPRSCPCGKTESVVACTQEVPTCNDTCGKLMECGVHRCQLKCHKDKCACLEIVTKRCRCSLHQKELPCGKEYTCETKCKRSKPCLRHICNRKCCDGMCPPCEKLCGRTLRCGNHKCPAVCHRGACYPCPQTAKVSCRCSSTCITVPCGRERRTHPPRCRKPCKITPDCHHEFRESHCCHFGDCPPCKQPCEKVHGDCGHACPAPCHTAVWVKQEDKLPAGPWEVRERAYRRQTLPCPPCVEPVSVTCLGKHESSQHPCSQSVPYSCGRLCGLRLQCGNHFCANLCHAEESECSECELPCERPRPEGCVHPCLLPCHPQPCESPCTVDVKVKCHCGITVLYIPCYLLTDAQKDESKVENLSCGNRCPKNLPCGHKCRANCHPGKCPNPESCRRKVKISCSCGRVKKDVSCDVIRRGEGSLDCDADCVAKQEDERIALELEKAKVQEENERKNREELEKFEKKFYGKKKVRERRRVFTDHDPSFLARHWVAIAVAAVAFILTFLIWYFS